MQLENNFTVPAGIDETWRAFNDPETVAPCFPGATLDSAEGDSFTGTVKVKLGPISLTYKGKGTFVERDEANHRVVIDAQGRDSRGNGTASAVVTGTMTPQGDAQTAVSMVTDMTVTGRPAQFGRGVIADVSDRIVGQFSSALAERLAAAGRTAEEPAPGGAATEAPAGAAANAGGARVAAAPAGSSNGAVRSRSSEIDAIDLLDTAGAPVLKRLVPVLAGLAAVVIVLLLRRARRSRRGSADADA